MPAYYRAHLQAFLDEDPDTILGTLSATLIQHFTGNYQAQVSSWQQQINILQATCQYVSKAHGNAASWGILLEYPLLRLQKRLDTVILAGQIVVVIEFKVGGTQYEPVDIRQVEDYALDLRDFHAASRHLTVVPVLCSTHATGSQHPAGTLHTVWPVQRTNVLSLPQLFEMFTTLQSERLMPQLELAAWDSSPYRPVPTIIEAAELLYAGHRVTEIAQASADAQNLADTSDRLVELVAYARRAKTRVVCFVTGIPGSGKTLTGLNLVHDPRETAKAVFLSGNSPLVEVLREALARDSHRRSATSLYETRRLVRTEIQHLMNYLREYLTENPSHCPPEHVIVFDEAQRAWDVEYGKRKFNRAASEPALFLEIMGRHTEWAVIVALVGSGQEINVGEGGLKEWGSALMEISQKEPQRRWEVFAAPDAVFGGPTTVGHSMFAPETDYPGILNTDSRLHLNVCVRSIRCESIATWVNHVLAGSVDDARAVARAAADFSTYITRSLEIARIWLKSASRGSRRAGLVASSGARRLRADGLGVSLAANDRQEYVLWYLQPHGDIRSSASLEVTANEYTCQGLELDYVGVCWGGDMAWSTKEKAWSFRRLGGAHWQAVNKIAARGFVRNKYRVLMTRSRLATVIWVPQGDPNDQTRDPKAFDETADFLVNCGARLLEPTSSSAAGSIPI